jgi:hypothetical protein
MKAKCGVEYESSTERPEDARFGLWYGGHVRFFHTKKEAEEALQALPASKREDANIGELPK